MARVPRPFLKRLPGFSCFGRLIENSQPETAHSMASRSVGVSAVTGAGCEDFEKAMVEACKELWARGIVRDKLHFTRTLPCGFETRARSSRRATCLSCWSSVETSRQSAAQPSRNRLGTAGEMHMCSNMSIRVPFGRFSKCTGLLATTR